MSTKSRHMRHVSRRAALTVFLTAFDDFAARCENVTPFQGMKGGDVAHWLDAFIKVKEARALLARLDGKE